MPVLPNQGQRPRRPIQKRIVPMQRLQVGTLSNSAEKTVFAYYDRTNIATGEARMFTASVGQNGKTLSDTNMQTPAMIPQGQAFQVKKLRVIFQATKNLSEANFKDLVHWISETVLEFQVGANKIMYQSPLSEILGNPWLLGVAPVTAGNTFNSFSGRTSGVVDMKEQPIQLASTVPFEIRIKQNGTADVQYIGDGSVKMLICLEGIRVFLH